MLEKLTFCPTSVLKIAAANSTISLRHELHGGCQLHSREKAPKPPRDLQATSSDIGTETGAGWLSGENTLSQA